MFAVPCPGCPVDIAPFSEVVYWTGNNPETLETHVLNPDTNESRRWWKPVDVPEQGGPHIGLQWDEPRRFCKVIVKWADAKAASQGASARLQYWHRSWPQIGLSGWNPIDDFYNGRWITAKQDIVREGDTVTFSFRPLDRTELDKEGIDPVTYRVANRIRLLFPTGVKPPIEYVQVIGDYVWKKVPIRIEFVGHKVPQEVAFEVHNGYRSDSQRVWKLDKSNVLNISFLVADVPQDSHDRTICTIRTADFSFSFLPLEAAQTPIFVRDFGVFTSSGEAYSKWAPGGKSVYDRVDDEPEQSYERASREIPQLRKTLQTPRPRYVPLGADGNRQEIAVMYNGDILIHRSALKSKPTENEPLLWPNGEDHLMYLIMTGATMDHHDGENSTRQWILDGYLPVIFSQWQTDGIMYTQQSFAATLKDSHKKVTEQRGDEATVLFSRITIANTLESVSDAHLWVAMGHPEQLIIEGANVFATADLKTGSGYDQPRLRFGFSANNRGKISVESVPGFPSVFLYTVQLKPSEIHQVELRIPFVTLNAASDVDHLMRPQFETELQQVVEYWKSFIDSGAQIETPEPLLNDFVRFQATHIAITADPDPLTGLVMLPAATYDYGVCGNEAMHQVRSLDLRGHHERAEQYLEPFLKLQGTRNLHGRFKNPEGALHGLRVSDDTDYQTFNYNLDHGFVLWMLCEHYKLTRNKDWASRIAENLVKACEFIIRERQATMRIENGKKVWEYGLLPPGHLEDPPEFHYWFAVNAYAARGMTDAAYVLKEINHPQAEKIRVEAESFMSDVRRAAKESMIRAPVVRLRDGTSVPFQPTRCLLRGRDWGWIRDSLYGPIHLLDCGVYDPRSDEATWILKDAEDNVFISPLYGRRLDDFEHQWFSQGGITIQANLLPNPLVYLKRGQAKHAIRAFYNSMAANLYPDVRVFCEHPVEAYGKGAGPFFKSPDESAFVTWLRYLLVLEDGETLKIAPGAPRAWFDSGREFRGTNLPTYFGPVSFSVFSEADKIKMEIQPPRRNPPESIEVSFRHPLEKPIATVTVNGRGHTDYDPVRGIVHFKEVSKLPDKVCITVRY